MNEYLDSVSDSTISSVSLVDVSELVSPNTMTISIFHVIVLIVLLCAIWIYVYRLLPGDLKQMVRFSRGVLIVFLLLGVSLCVILYSIEQLIPGADRFLTDRDGRFNLTFISAIIAGFIFFLERKERERNRVLGIKKENFRLIIDAAIDYFVEVDEVVDEFKSVFSSIASHLVWRQREIDQYNELDEQSANYLMENADKDDDDFYDKFEQSYQQKKDKIVADRDMMITIFANHQTVEEMVNQHKALCKKIAYGLNAKFERFQLLVKSEKIDSDILENFERLNNTLNEIRKGYDTAIRSYLSNTTKFPEYYRKHDDMRRKLSKQVSESKDTFYEDLSNLRDKLLDY